MKSVIKDVLRWLKQRSWISALCAVLFVSSFFTFNRFLTQPKISADEGINIQLARSFAETGSPYLQSAPGVPSPDSFRYNASSGWVIPTSLGIAFKLFGSSFFVARCVMAVYLFGLTIAVFFLLRKWFGLRAATLGCLLIVTFASLYGNGKMVQGEVPAAFWLTLGLIADEFLRSRPRARLILSAIGFGIFFSTKLTFIFLGAPALFVIMTLRVWKKEQSLREFLSFWALVAAMVFPTFWFGSIHPWTISHLLQSFHYYTNNYYSRCVSCDVKRNLLHLVTHSTLLHLDALMVLAAAFLLRSPKALRDWRIQWSIVYGGFTLMYFMKSPGTLRYLMHLQLGLLAIAPVTMTSFAEQFFSRWKWLGTSAISALIIVQAIHTFAFSDMLTSDLALRLEKMVHVDLADRKTIGVVALPVAGAVVPSHQLIQFNAMNGKPDGENPLDWSDDRLPEILIYSTRGDLITFVATYAEKIRQHYDVKADFGDGTYIVEEKKVSASR